MGFEMFWYFKPRIAQIVTHGEFQLQDMERLHTQIIGDYFISGAPVHIIMDVRAMTQFPMREGKIATLFDQLLLHPACGRLIVIRADNPIQFFLMSSITQMIGNRFQQARSLNEAVAILQGHDTSLYKLA